MSWTGFITEDGQVVPAGIEHLGEANTYETEKRLYCPCPRPGGDCFLKRSHRHDNLSCDYAGGEHGA